MNSKPVIFLAFANDKVDNTTYLRNLSSEMHGIRKALAEAVSSGLCEVVERSSASVADILDVFQDPVYASRISIFHYGGHANGFSLLLESEDGSRSVAHKEGLVPFLARQQNLKLIFLNGCSSEGQAIDLLKAGIPAVISTTTFINDEVATRLAIRFYSSLGDGSGIEKAWIDATDEAKISSGTSSNRALYWEGKNESTDRFPWVIQFRQGANVIKGWNLPDVSGNPLYGLPAIPSTFNLPESPFLYLNRYERRHAEVFFGRSNMIRNLYSSVNDKEAPPIILLYGQSGAGKSSILESGLQPRLESGFATLYLRRNSSIGLSATVYNALLEEFGYTPVVSIIPKADLNDPQKIVDDLTVYAEKLNDAYKTEIHQLIEKLSSLDANIPKETADQETAPKEIFTAWKLVEQKLSKPLVIILDQIEEAYTRPNERLGNEMNQLFIDLKKVFSNAESLPQGKIILSFRKEYYPEIEEYCKNYELPRSKRYVEHITKSDVLEVFKGFVDTPRLKSRYNLRIEEGLPEIIATDLTADKDTLIAPMLQILLTKMWIKALSIDSVVPQFSHELYRGLKEEGLAMDEFLQHQLGALKMKFADLYKNGFILDLLGLFCTLNGTAAAVTQKQLLDNYPGAGEEALKVLAACEERFLISDLGGNDKTAILAHDTLAKSVIKLQQRATNPLQQAKRILSSSMEGVRGGSELTTLNIWELQLIDKVKKFLPVLGDDEQILLETSRKEIIKKEREKNNLIKLKRVVAALMLVASVALGILYIQSKKNETASYINMMTASSGVNLSKDHTLAMQQALYGMHKKGESSSVESKSALSKAYYYPIENPWGTVLPWYKNIFNTYLNCTDLIYNDEVKLMIPFAESDSLRILDYLGNEKGVLVSVPIRRDNEDFETTFLKLKWSNDGRAIVAINSGGMIQFHDSSGQLKKIIGGISVRYSTFDISNTTNEVVTFRKSVDDTFDLVQIFNIDGKIKDSIVVTLVLRDIHFALDGINLIPERQGDLDHTLPIQIINQEGVPGINFNSPVELNSMSRSPAGNSIVFRGYHNSIYVFNENYRLIKTIDYSKFYDEYTAAINVVYSPIDSFLAFRFNKTDVHIYNIFKKTTAADPIILKHERTVSCISFSNDGKSILTGSDDNIARIWNMNGRLLYTLAGHTGDVTGGKFLENDCTVITTSSDGSVRLWELDNIQDIKFASGKGPDVYFDYDPSVKYAVSSGSDRALRIWDLKNKRQLININFEAYGLRTVKFIDSSYVLSITSNNSLFLYRLEDGNITLFGKKPQANILFATAMGEKIISANVDSITYWDRSGIEVKSFSTGNKLNGNYSVYNDSLLAVSTYQGTILLYGYSGEYLGELAGHTSFVDYLDFCPNGRFLISVSLAETIIWDLKFNKFVKLKTKDCKANEQKCPYQVLKANFSNAGNLVVTTSVDRHVKLWNLEGTLLATMIGHANDLQNAFFSPDDKMIYSYAIDGTIRLWDLSGKEISVLNHGASINNARMNINMKEFYSSADDGTLRVWITPNGIYDGMKQSGRFLLAEPKINIFSKWLKFPASNKFK